MADQPKPLEESGLADKTRHEALKILNEFAAAVANGQCRGFMLLGVGPEGRVVGTIVAHDGDLQTLSDGLVEQSKKLLLICASDWSEQTPPNNQSTIMN